MKYKGRKIKLNAKVRLRLLKEKLAAQPEPPTPAQPARARLRDSAPMINHRFPYEGTKLTALSYRWITWIWFIALLSLIIDAILPMLPLALLFPPEQFVVIQHLLSIVLSCAALMLFRREIFEFFEKIDLSPVALKKSLSETPPSTLLLTAALIVATVGYAIFSLRDYFSSLMPILTFIVAGLASLGSAFRGYKNQGEFYGRLQDDRAFAIVVKDQQVFVLALIAILLARGVSLLAALLLALGTISSGTYLAYFGLTLFLLLAFKPELGDYITSCPRCVRPAPRGVKKIGYCVECERSVPRA